MKIYQYIRQAREEKGWTQEQLAQKVYTSAQAISLYEKGLRSPNLEMLEQMLNALDLEFSISKRPYSEKKEEIERWSIEYADTVMVLFLFFMVLFAFTNASTLLEKVLVVVTLATGGMIYWGWGKWKKNRTS